MENFDDLEMLRRITDYIRLMREDIPAESSCLDLIVPDVPEHVRVILQERK